MVNTNVYETRIFFFFVVIDWWVFLEGKNNISKSDHVYLSLQSTTAKAGGTPGSDGLRGPFAVHWSPFLGISVFSDTSVLSGRQGSTLSPWEGLGRKAERVRPIPKVTQLAHGGVRIGSHPSLPLRVLVPAARSLRNPVYYTHVHSGEDGQCVPLISPWFLSFT